MCLNYEGAEAGLYCEYFYSCRCRGEQGGIMEFIVISVWELAALAISYLFLALFVMWLVARDKQAQSTLRQIREAQEPETTDHRDR